MIKELFFDRIYQQLIKEEENVLLSGFVCVRLCVHFNIPWREERGGTVGVSRHLGWWNLSTAEPHPLLEECCSTTTTLTTDKGQISSHLHRKHIISRCVCVYGCVTKIIRIVNYYCRKALVKKTIHTDDFRLFLYIYQDDILLSTQLKTTVFYAILTRYVLSSSDKTHNSYNIVPSVSLW